MLKHRVLCVNPKIRRFSFIFIYLLFTYIFAKIRFRGETHKSRVERSDDSALFSKSSYFNLSTQLSDLLCNSQIANRNQWFPLFHDRFRKSPWLSLSASSLSSLVLVRTRCFSVTPPVSIFPFCLVIASLAGFLVNTLCSG